MSSDLMKYLDPQVVAMIDVPTMAVGLTALLAARMAMAVAGMSWIELVLMAR